LAITAVDTFSRTHTNSAFENANTVGRYANAAYVQANTATTAAAQADQRAVTSGDYANSAFITANTKLSAAGGTVSGDLTVSGNLTINGTAARFSVPTLTVEDSIIDISAETIGTPTQNSGIRVIRGDENAVLLRWNELVKSWQFTNDGVIYSNIASSAAESYANAAYLHANASYNQANTLTGFVASASSYANGAFAAANTADAKSVISGGYANSAYSQANTGTILAQAAYNSANTIIADSLAFSIALG